MQGVWRGLAAVAVITAGCTAATADDLQDCRGSDLDRKIAGCSRIISKHAPPPRQAGKNAKAKARAGKPGSAAGGARRKLLSEAYVRRGAAYGRRGEHERALADLDAAIDLQPDNAATHRERGIIHRNKGDYERSLADLDEAIRLNPRLAGAYNSRGLTHRARRDLDRAMADFNEAIRLDPAFVSAHANRAWLHFGARRHGQGLADVDQALKVNPDDAGSLYVRGRLLEALGRRNEAITDYRRLLKQSSTEPADMQRQTIVKERMAKLTRGEPAPATSAGRRVALVIGNANYVHASDLPNPRNDARAVAASLRRLKFSEVIEEHDAKRETLARALKRFGDSAATAEWAVIFFAGHGLELNGTTYVIPTDAELKRDTHVLDEAIPLDLMTAKVDGASKLGLIILDACRNNPFIARMRRSANVRSLGHGLANLEPEGDVLVAYSARHGTVADDGSGRHSPYTEALIAHLEEPGLEINFLFRRVRDDVLKKTDRRQHPFLYGALGSEPLYFAAAR